MQSGSNAFAELFLECNSTPNDMNIPELVSITIGIFSDAGSQNVVIGGRADFKPVFELFLAPYFSGRKRCLGIGEYFCYGDVKFKVLGAFPSYGVISRNTAIYCSQVLSSHPMNKVQILPIAGRNITQALFASVISPFFKHRPRHISTGQYLYLNSNEYMTVATQPIDGVVNPNTQFYFEGQPLQYIQQMTLLPYFEELPAYCRSLSKEELTAIVVHFYLMPYFQGFKRAICQGRDVLIDGVNFYVENAYPPNGVASDSTAVIYEGSFKSRNAQPEIMFVPRNGEMNSQITELNRQLFQLQLLMQGLEVPTEVTDPRVVERLPTHTLRSLPSNPEAARCMICLNDYEIGDLVKTLPCFHMFHPQCINEWLGRSELCPLCKTSVQISGE